MRKNLIHLFGLVLGLLLNTVPSQSGAAEEVTLKVGESLKTSYWTVRCTQDSTGTLGSEYRLRAGTYTVVDGVKVVCSSGVSDGTNPAPSTTSTPKSYDSRIENSDETITLMGIHAVLGGRRYPIAGFVWDKGPDFVCIAYPCRPAELLAYSDGHDVCEYFGLGLMRDGFAQSGTNPYMDAVIVKHGKLIVQFGFIESINDIRCEKK